MSDDTTDIDPQAASDADAPQATETIDWKAKAEEYLNSWKRAAADFDNYQKRRVKEDQELLQFSRHMVLTKLLPSLEALEQALTHAPQNKEFEVWARGIHGIKDSLNTALKELGVEKIKTIGADFSHELHEAVEMVEGEKSGKITEEVAPGYTIAGRVVKPAKVKVAK